MKNLFFVFLLALTTASAFACDEDGDDCGDANGTEAAVSDTQEQAGAKTCGDYASYEEMPADCQQAVDKIRDQIKPSKSKTEMWEREAADRHHEDDLEREYERIKRKQTAK